MTIRIASAPASFGVFAMTVGRPNLPDGPQLARTIAEAGYAGTELGPPAYFGEGAQAAELLGEYDLTLVAALLPQRFSRREAHAEDTARLDRTLSTLEAAVAGGELPRVLLCDAVHEPERIDCAGAIEQHPEAWLPDARFATLLDAVHRSAERCRERGFGVAFHHHAGSYVETPREIARFAEALDASLLGLCFDVGQSVFGGGDPLELVREFGELVAHVHLKDVDLAKLQAVRESGGGLMEAWESGVFCALGTGGAQVGECLDELQGQGYDGWIVVEQDHVHAPDEPFEQVVEDARANRAWLAERGL